MVTDDLVGHINAVGVEPIRYGTSREVMGVDASLSLLCERGVRLPQRVHEAPIAGKTALPREFREDVYD